MIWIDLTDRELFTPYTRKPRTGVRAVDAAVKELANIGLTVVEDQATADAVVAYLAERGVPAEGVRVRQDDELEHVRLGAAGPIPRRWRIRYRRASRRWRRFVLNFAQHPTGDPGADDALRRLADSGYREVEVATKETADAVVWCLVNAHHLRREAIKVCIFPPPDDYDQFYDV